MKTTEHFFPQYWNFVSNFWSAYHLNGIFLRFFLTNGTILFLTDETERIELYNLSGMPGWSLGSTKNMAPNLLWCWKRRRLVKRFWRNRRRRLNVFCCSIYLCMQGETWVESLDTSSKRYPRIFWMSLSSFSYAEVNLRNSGEGGYSYWKYPRCKPVRKTSNWSNEASVNFSLVYGESRDNTTCCWPIEWLFLANLSRRLPWGAWHWYCVQNGTKISGKSGETEKKEIPWKVLPFFRKISTGMNCSIWILTGISRFSEQMVSALGLRG